MTSSIPGAKRERFFEKKAFVEGTSVVPPIIAGTVAAIVNLQDPGKKTLGWLLLAAAIWLTVASVLKVLHAHSQDEQEQRRQDYEGLWGALHVMYATITTYLPEDGSGNGKLRATVHRVDRASRKGKPAEELEQILPYIGGSGSPPGRRFSVRSGIIGKAVREKAAFTASRQNDDHETFLAELIRDWSYTEEDARKLSPDRRSWMAVPIFGKKQIVVAVVYLDSAERDFFDNRIKSAVLGACGGIASYISEVY